MNHPISSLEMTDDHLLSPRRLVVLATAVLWVIFACGLPLQNAHEARRQAHLRITRVFTEGKPDAANVVTAFDQATQDVIAAATLPCLFLAVFIVYLIHQMLKLKRRYLALERALHTSQSQGCLLRDESLG